MAMRRARMTIAYKGDQFHGFATNPGVDTVASTIEGALAQILQEEVKVCMRGDKSLAQICQTG
jgi:tRNA pseudouridine(38-40) synthase